jgi:predicted nucleic acid-binding protein
VEIASALWRLVREGVVPEQAAREAEALADEVLRRVHVIGDIERVKALARRLLRVHGLRAADALQLGAALSWADGHPEDLVMHTLDRRLGAAAEREGFHVVPPP